MSFDYSKLKGKIVEMYGTQDEFASALGVGRVTLSQRLNSKSDFNQLEICKSAELLHIKKSDIPIYFFTPKV